MKLLTLFLLLGSTTAALSQKQLTPAYRGQPTLIYKTRKDYRNRVPVLLSADKSRIIAYPAPTDVYYQGKLAIPVKLKRGYLLDNRGIGRNVAFLTVTYQAYAKLTEVPSLAELYSQILDNDPLTELYDCGNRSGFKNVVSELNEAIKTRKLTAYQKIE